MFSDRPLDPTPTPPAGWTALFGIHGNCKRTMLLEESGQLGLRSRCLSVCVCARVRKKVVQVSVAFISEKQTNKTTNTQTQTHIQTNKTHKHT